VTAEGAAPRGAFVAFEGIEGCGKSTQIERLSARLARGGRPFIVTREPGGTPLGDALRSLLLSPASRGVDGLIELYLLEASRRAHVFEVILPALDRGRVVLCDRFADSSVAYQGGGRELGVEMVEAMNLQATGGLAPDATILLDLPPEEGLARVGRRPRPEDRMEREALAFHERVRAAYLALAERRGDAYCVIDGLRPPEEVFAAVWDYLGRRSGGAFQPSADPTGG
jgi:dTMP kinase